MTFDLLWQFTGVLHLALWLAHSKHWISNTPAISTAALISHASKIMLKFLQARLQCTWTENFQMFKLDLEKAKEPEIKLPASIGS